MSSTSAGAAGHGGPSSSQRPSDVEQSLRDMSAQLQHKVAETKEEAAARAEELRGKAALQAKEARRQASYAWHDTRRFVSQHPFVVLILLTSAILLGTPSTGSSTHTLQTYMHAYFHTGTAYAPLAASVPTGSLCTAAGIRHVPGLHGRHVGLAGEGNSQAQPSSSSSSLHRRSSRTAHFLRSVRSALSVWHRACTAISAARRSTGQSARHLVGLSVSERLSSVAHRPWTLRHSVRPSSKRVIACSHQAVLLVCGDCCIWLLPLFCRAHEALDTVLKSAFVRKSLIKLNSSIPHS